MVLYRAIEVLGQDRLVLLEDTACAMTGEFGELLLPIAFSYHRFQDFEERETSVTHELWLT
jgi:hypothetical protein